MNQVRGWLLVLCLLLVVWEPLNLALVASAWLPDLQFRGAAFAGLLTVRVAVTGFGLVAGLAIWRRQPGAALLARIALVAQGAMSILVMVTPIFPGNRLPGTLWPLLGLNVTWYAAWVIYLARSKRVRAVFEGGGQTP